jgi:hypothetical protein
LEGVDKAGIDHRLMPLLVRAYLASVDQLVSFGPADPEVFEAPLERDQPPTWSASPAGLFVIYISSPASSPSTCRHAATRSRRKGAFEERLEARLSRQKAPEPGP